MGTRPKEMSVAAMVMLCSIALPHVLLSGDMEQASALLRELSAEENSDSFVTDLLADYRENKKPTPKQVRMMAFDDRLGTIEGFHEALADARWPDGRIVLPLLPDFTCEFAFDTFLPTSPGYLGTVGSCLNQGTSSVRILLMPNRAFTINVSSIRRRVRVESVSAKYAIVYEAGRTDMSQSRM